MPPKTKVCKEQILQCGLMLVRKKGLGALTAKQLAEKLSCSTQPIFWHYESMDALKKDIFNATLTIFGKYLRRDDPKHSPYLAIGLNYIRFAAEERELFRLLFMSDFGHIDVIDARVEMDFILGVIEDSEDIPEELSQIVYQDMWLFSHGIAAMMATGTASFTEAETETMLSDVYRGLLANLKTKNLRKE